MKKFKFTLDDLDNMIINKGFTNQMPGQMQGQTPRLLNLLSMRGASQGTPALGAAQVPEIKTFTPEIKQDKSLPFVRRK